MPVSMRLGWRLRHTSTAVPSALRPSASSRKRTLLTGAPLRRPSRARPTRSLASRPHSEPPAQVSRFQIGTDALRVSMQKRAASNASPRWGADAATTTEVSPIASGPVRCSRASRPVDGPAAPGLVSDLPRAGARPAPHRPRIRAADTASRPSAWSRAVPENTTTAPQSGRTAQSFTTPADSTPSVSSSQVSLWLGGSSTRSC